MWYYQHNVNNNVETVKKLSLSGSFCESGVVCSVSYRTNERQSAYSDDTDFRVTVYIE